MGGPEFVITIVTIACVTSLIKKWLDKNEESEVKEEPFNGLANAFIEHKKEMQQRIENLKAIIAEQGKEKYSQIEARNNEGTLTNDLKNKNKARS